MKLAVVSALLPVAVVMAQDPAQGWLGYATGVNPAGTDTPITFMEAYWKNCDDPKESGAFFSPWFGCVRARVRACGWAGECGNAIRSRSRAPISARSRVKVGAVFVGVRLRCEHAAAESLGTSCVKATT